MMTKKLLYDDDEEDDDDDEDEDLIGGSVEVKPRHRRPSRLVAANQPTQLHNILILDYIVDEEHDDDHDYICDDHDDYSCKPTNTVTVAQYLDCNVYHDHHHDDQDDGHDDDHDDRETPFDNFLIFVQL